MAIDARALLEDVATDLGQSLYLSPSIGVDILINGRRYLQAGFIETDTGQFDTTAHQGSHAGSSTPSTQGGAIRYVRIT